MLTVADETSAILVLSGGLDWDAELVGAAAAVETESREREFDALERVLRFIEDDRLVIPREDSARTRLALDLVAIGWCRQGVTPEPNGEET